MRQRTIAIVIAVVSLHGGIAAAQPAGDLAKAKAHYEQGEAYFKAGTFDRSVAEYKAAYALVPRSGLLFNIGLSLEMDGKHAEAVAVYQQYVDADQNGAKVTEARARMEALGRKLEEVRARAATIAAHRKQADQLIASGKQVEAIAPLRELYTLEKNSATLFEIARAYDSGGQDELARAEYGRYIDTGDPEFATEAAARRAELEKKANPVGPVRGPLPPAKPSERKGIIWPAASTGASAVLLGVGIGFGLRTNGIKSDLQTNLDGRNPPLDNSDPRISKGQSSATFTTGFLAAGVIAAGVSGYLWWKYLSQETSGSPAEPNAAQVFVTGDITDDNETIGLGIGGTF